MKYIPLILFLVTGISYGQIDIRGSMGINFISTPSLRDYLNQNYRTDAEYSTFNSAIGFSGEINYYFSESFAAGVELAYIYNSFTHISVLGKRELTYDFIMPSITAYYLVTGTGYNFKFGGGAGIRLSGVEENTSFNSRSYNTSGMGFLLKADGNTLLGGGVFANIGIDLRYDMNGKYNIAPDHEIKLDAVSLGIRLGLTYIFETEED